jgi:ribosome-associated protein
VSAPRPPRSQSPNWIEVAPGIGVPTWELEFSYVRSSGPGGQNVNKVNSKAVMRWSPRASSGLPPAVLERFLAQYVTRINEDGSLVFTSDETRSQSMNAEACVRKLVEMIRAVARPPKIRRATKPTRVSVKKRRSAKAQAGEKKRLRGRVSRGREDD